MSRYDIFIHDQQYSARHTEPKKIGGSFTTPWEQKAEEDKMPTIQEVKSTVVSALPFVGRVAAIATAFYAAAKIGLTITDKVTSYLSAETGRYTFQTKLTNFQKVLSNVFNPVSSVEAYFRAEQAQRLITTRNNEQIKLLGDSVLNQTTRGF